MQHSSTVTRMSFSSPIARPAVIEVFETVQGTPLATILNPFGDEPMLETKVPLGFSAAQQLMLTWYHTRKLAPQGFRDNQITWGEF